MRRGRPRHPELLTPREQEVLDLLREGLTNQQIADRLGISLYGARYHVSEIISKLGVSTRQEAAEWQGEPSVDRTRWFGFVPLPALFGRPALEAVMRTSSVMLVGAGVAGFALLLAGVLLVAARDGEPAPALGLVAYVVDGNVWVTDLPDGPPLQLTDSGMDLSPQWSVSGEWLTFAREYPDTGGAERWVMRKDGSDARQVQWSYFDWSPTQDRFVYRGEDGQIVVEDADGSSRHEIEPERSVSGFSMSLIPGTYRWTPDGQWITYVEYVTVVPDDHPGGYCDCKQYVVYKRASTDGSQHDVLFQSEPAHDTPVLNAWSPDGAIMYFHMNQTIRDDDPPVETLTSLQFAAPGDDALRSTEDVLGLRTRDDAFYSSPDGTRLVVTAGRSLESWQDRRVVLLKPTDGSTVPLTAAVLSALDPAWSPDGNAIAFTAAPAAPGAEVRSTEARNAMSQRRIWLMEPDGRNPRLVTNDDHYRDEVAIWAHDSTHILFARVAVDSPQPFISLWLLDTSTGDTTLVAETVFTSPDRVPFEIDYRDYDALWSQLFAYWRPR